MTATDETVRSEGNPAGDDPPRSGDTERPGPPDELERSGPISAETSAPRVPPWLGDPEATVNLTGEVSFSTVRDDEVTVSVRGDLADIPVRDDDATVNIAGDILFPRVRDDLAEHSTERSIPRAAPDGLEGDGAAVDGPLPADTVPPGPGGYDDPAPASEIFQLVPPESAFGDEVSDTGPPSAPDGLLDDVSRQHLRGLLEALVFASDKPLSVGDLAKASAADKKDVKALLAELQAEYAPRGVHLAEVAGGWVFRTSPAYAPFIRDLTGQKPIKLSRAQLETLSILAYRQPITRPEIDDIRGVDCGPVLKVLLERDLIRILGKKDEPGRPLLYGTTPYFLEFFGLRSLKDLPTLREFAELTDESRRVVERELGDVLPEAGAAGASLAASGDPVAEGNAPATLPPEAPGDELPVTGDPGGPSA